MTSDPLSIDISRDMSLIDGFMTKILHDTNIWESFLRDPNSFLVRYGIHPPTSPEINERVNRIFYATLSNTELNAFVFSALRSFPTSADDARSFAEGAERGELAHGDLDLRAADHFLRNPAYVRRILDLSLHDLNRRALLNQRYSDNEISSYIDTLATAIAERRAVSTMPILEEWDRHYGVGKHFGALFVEVGPLVTAAVGVEFAAAVTVFVTMPLPDLQAQFERALVGSSDQAVRSIKIISRLLHFAADMVHYTRAFERG